MINIITMFMFISICVGIFLFRYIMSNGRIHYMKYLAVMIACVVIYIFAYMIELHSNSLETALFWNGIQYLVIPLISTLWLVMVLLYVGIITKTNSRIIALLFIIPAITYIVRWTNASHFLYYTGYTFKIYGEAGILELGKGPCYYVYQIYECIETFFVILIFWIYSYKVSADERKSYRLMSLITATSTISILILIFDPTNLGLDYTAIIFPAPLFMLAYLIAKEDFFEISSTARNQIFYQSSEAIIILNDKNRVIDYNMKAIDFFRENGIELTNSYLNMFYNENSRLIEALNVEDWSIYTDIVNDKLRYWKISSNIILAKNRRKHGIIKTIRDITREYVEKKYLEKISKVDELTQIFNRREFNERAAKMLVESQKNDTQLILMMFDIDYFKKINDTFGHPIGDIVLQRIAKEAKSSFKEEAVLARFGGEEFVVMLAGVSEMNAEACAEAYRRKISDLRIIPSDPNYRFTISIGMAIYESKMSLKELIQNADSALYQAKNSGRNKVMKYVKSSSPKLDF